MNFLANPITFGEGGGAVFLLLKYTHTHTHTHTQSTIERLQSPNLTTQTREVLIDKMGSSVIEYSGSWILWSMYSRNLEPKKTRIVFPVKVRLDLLGDLVHVAPTLHTFS